MKINFKESNEFILFFTQFHIEINFIHNLINEIEFKVQVNQTVLPVVMDPPTLFISSREIFAVVMFMLYCK